MPAENNQLSLSDIFMIQPMKKLQKEEEEDDDDDTLSFSGEWLEFSGESKSSSGTSFTSLSSSSFEEEDGDNSFEFFSEEWKKNVVVSDTPENIIFCGKLIPSKKQQPFPENARIPQQKITRIPGNPRSREQKSGRGGLFRIFRTKIGASRKGVENNRDYYCLPAKDDDVHKLSVVRSSPSGKSRWLLVFFGFSRVPNEAMELRGIKNRRNSRKMTSSPSIRTENGDGENAIVSCGGGDGARRRLWRLIRALSCGGSHHSLIRSVGGVDGLGFS